MTIDELMDHLADARHELGGAAPVRIAYQPAWPLRAAVAAVTVPATRDPGGLYGEDDTAAGQDQDGTMCWLATREPPRDENPYAPSWAWDGDQAEEEVSW